MTAPPAPGTTPTSHGSPTSPGSSSPPPGPSGRVATMRPALRGVVGAGNRSVNGIASLGTAVLQFGVLALWHTVYDLILRLRYRKVVLQQVSDVVIGAGGYVLGSGMILVIFSLSFLAGTTVGLQGYTGLEQIGAESFSGLIGSFANVREVTPVIAGVALAAQVGTSFTAEIGAMRVSDEIDALETMGIPSFVYLVCTRLLATLIALVPLYLVALFTSFAATRLITTRFFDLSPGIYDYYFDLYLPPIDVVYSVIKFIVFTFLVVLIHCYYGYYATGGPSGVGRAVGRAVRLAISAIVVVNLLLSFVFWGTSSTVSLTG